MPCQNDVLLMISKHAQDVVGYFHNVEGDELAYDAEGIAILAETILDYRESLQPAIQDSLIGDFGAYLGECIRRELGGEWEYIAGELYVRILPNLVAYPFAQVEAQFRLGEIRSIARFFDTISILRVIDRTHGDSPLLD